MPHSLDALLEPSNDPLGSEGEVFPVRHPSQSPVFVLSSFSGAGKNTVANLARDVLYREGVECVNSAARFTTRQIRPGEVNGVDGYFVTGKEFDSLRCNGRFLYSYDKYGVSYGFSSDVLTEELNIGPVFVVGGEVNTACTLKDSLVSRGFSADGVFIYRQLPDILRSIRGRAANELEVQLRLEHVTRSWRDIRPEGFRVIDNTVLGSAVSDMVNLVKSRVSSFK